MESPVHDYLSDVLTACRPHDGGAVAGSIPRLAEADPDRFAVSLATVEGAVYGAGDTDQLFTMQSLSKPFVHAMALAERGLQRVRDTVDVEPSGEAFGELSLDEDSGRPANPMINAGAIAVRTLIGEPGTSEQQRQHRILDRLSAFAGRPLSVDEEEYRSEEATAFRNYAIGNMLRSHQTITGDPMETVRGYIAQCAVLVTTRDLALMAATLANGGIQPLTGEQVVGPDVVREVLSVMTTCGMYDAAGDWVATVGIPAKSGISGGILGTLPGQVGLASYSPRLDQHGSSVRGVELYRRISAEMGLHLMEASHPARAAIRRTHTVRQPGGDRAEVYALHGTLQFAGAERLVRDLTGEGPATTDVVLDLSEVHSVNDVARRMLLETVRRLTGEGHRVTLVDPGAVLPDPDCGEGVRPHVVSSLGPGAEDG